MNRFPPQSNSESEETSESEYCSEDSDVSDLSDHVSWIEWYCQQNKFLVQVDEDYIQDGFNMTGLNAMVPQYEAALATILDEEVSDYYDAVEIEEEAKILYGYIHARYIITAKGIQCMLEKFNKNEYGTCPNVACELTRVMPSGTSDTYGQDTAKVFCVRCCELYVPRYTRLERTDGACFGTTFSAFFFLVNQGIVPKTGPRTYVPRIYGFKVHNSVRVLGKAKALENAEKGNSIDDTKRAVACK